MSTSTATVTRRALHIPLAPPPPPAMPSRTLPTFSWAEVEAHSSEDSCYVLLGKNVYDVTDFIHDHPGGAGLVLDYGGKDITHILKDEASHTHSDTAYEVLDDSLVGFLETGPFENGNGHVKTNGATTNGGASTMVNGAGPTDPDRMVRDESGRMVHPRTGMACEEDLNKETNIGDDYKRHKFLDLSKPLLPQVWNGGFTKEFYLDQVHRPRHYKGGKSAPLFGSVFLEPLSMTPWWMVPLLWLPPVAWGLYTSAQGFENKVSSTAGIFGIGFLLWSLLEYVLHRFLFHLDYYLPDHHIALTLHFLLHGVHHYLPMDKYRLVMPPALFVVLATPFYKLAHFLFWWDWNVATAGFCGGIFGYICYDLTHYFLHHQNLPLWYKGLKKYHLAHHFLDYELGFGVTSRFWDRVFGTELVSLVKTN